MVRRLRHAGVDRRPNNHHAHRHGCGCSRHPARSGNRRGSRHDQRDCSRSGLLRNRHGQHGHADHGPQADATGRVRRLSRHPPPADGGEEADLTFRGRTAPVKHLMPNNGFVRFDEPMPIYVSAFGPKALGVAARRGDGLITSVPPNPAAVEMLRTRIEAAGAEAGRTISRDEFPVATLTTMLVLEDGESLDSERVRRQTGAFAIASVHYLYEQVVQFGRRPPAHLADFWDDYVALVEQTPPERRHQRIHEGHNCWVTPEEEPFITPELIDSTCLVGTSEQLIDRIHALDDAGLDQLVLLPPLAEKEAVIRSVAEHVLPALADGDQCHRQARANKPERLPPPQALTP
ncbi:MAG: LLM class flavin-dependent oxidoreductase [Actinobacteria bacterium]|nr:LLM class flavin-dependent oxidoreductase [Actinomycetota bacterium]